MTAWTEVIGTFALALAVLLAPGLALGLALQLRGLLLLGSAAPLSVAVVATSAVVAPEVGVRWSALVPVALTLGGVAVLLTSRALAERAGPRRTSIEAPAHDAAVLRRSRRSLREDRGEEPFTWLPGLVGAALGAVLIAATVRHGLWSPDLVSQAYDIVFHLNAVHLVLETGDASSLHLSRLTDPGSSTPYPAGWHGVVSLVVLLSGSSVVVATNVVALAVAAVVWPLSVVALVRQVVPRSPAAAAAGGVLAAALPAFPTLLLVWGVVYPVLLATALLPAVIAAVVCLLRREPAGESAPVAAALLVAGLGVVGLALAHPSALFALAALAGPLLVGVLARAARQAWARPAARVRLAVGAAALLLVAGGAAVALAGSATLSSVGAYVWPARASVPQAVGEALLGAPPEGRPGGAWVSLLALCGAVLLLRGRRHRWLVAAWGVAGALYVVAQTTDTHPLTAPWYNDPYRLAPLVAVPAVVLASAGLTGLLQLLDDLLSASRGRPATWALAASSSVAVMLALVASMAPGSGTPSSREALAAGYALGDSTVSPLVSAEELTLYSEMADAVPPGAVVANDPYDGSALMMALADRQPLFTHFTGSWTDQQRLVAARLDQVATDPEVCRAAQELGVTHLVVMGKRYFDWLPKAAWFDGVRAAPGSGAFVLVSAVGEARLYRLTACAAAEAA